MKSGPKLPAVNFFNYNDVFAFAQEKLDDYQKALSDKEEVARERDMRKEQAEKLLRQRDEVHEAMRKAQSVIQALETENKNLKTEMAHEKNKANAEIADMREFILVSGNHIRFQEFLLQQQEERKQTKSAEREQQIRKDAERQNQQRGMRMR